MVTFVSMSVTLLTTSPTATQMEAAQNGAQMTVAGATLAARGVRRRLGTRRLLCLVWTASLGYFCLVLLLTWQALRGQSVVAPDAITLGALAALATGVAVAVTAA